MKKFLLSILIFMSLLVVGVTTVLNKSLSPLRQAKAETIELAERRADLAEADEFYWYNGNDTYLTITGKNSEQEAVIIIVEQEGGEITVLNEEGTFSKGDAIRQVVALENPARILEARIGIHEQMPIWEISFRQENGRIGYTMFSLSTGEWIRTIKNI